MAPTKTANERRHHVENVPTAQSRKFLDLWPLTALWSALEGFSSLRTLIQNYLYQIFILSLSLQRPDHPNLQRPDQNSEKDTFVPIRLSKIVPFKTEFTMREELKNANKRSY